jgi:hypothetical protein
MARGSFQPLKDSVRFFARPRTFTIECVYCGKLLFIGPRERDNHTYNPITSMVRCPDQRQGNDGVRGCGRKFLVGLVAYPLKRAGRCTPNKAQSPPDQIPEPHQLAEIRAEARARLARLKKKRPGDHASPHGAPS